MYFRNTILAYALLVLLFMVAIGCGKSPSGGIAVSGTHDLDTLYEQLLRKRLNAQEKVFEAMELYRTNSQNVRRQRALLQNYLEGKSVSDAIELFSKGQISEIPADLRVAYSSWRTLLPDETQRLRIVAWIDQQQFSGLLEEMDVNIKIIENGRQFGRLDENDRSEIDRLLAMSIGDIDSAGTSNVAFYEQEAIEKLKRELVNEEMIEP